jgi:2-dehydro-3-deoxyglucarate aldolase/4-hydroxy-2-oxoheptanedioate aldolase
MKFNIRKQLKKKELLIGALISIPAPEVAEILAEVGYDWLFVDTEHGSFNARGAQGILQAVDHRCPCVVRIPSNEEVRIACIWSRGPARR